MISKIRPMVAVWFWRQTRLRQPLMRSTFIKIWLVCTMICYLIADTIAAENGFQADLDVTFLRYSSGEKIQYRFTVAVQNRNWLIKSSPNVAGAFPITEIGYDGEFTYKVVYLNGEPNEPEYDGKTISVNAEITPGEMIKFDYNRMIYPWFAYRQPHSLKTLRDRQELNFLFTNVKSKSHWCVDSETTNVMNSALVDRIVLYDIGYIHTTDGKSFRRNASYQNGFTNLIFDISEWTNSGASAIPSQFKYYYFNPRENGSSSNDLELSWTIDGKVSAISQLPSEFSFRPVLKAQAYISDGRSAMTTKIPSISYVARDWIATNQELYIETLNNELKNARSNNKWKDWFWFLH